MRYFTNISRDVDLPLSSDENFNYVANVSTEIYI